MDLTEAGGTQDVHCLTPADGVARLIFSQQGLGERIVVKTEPGTGPSPQPGPRAASAVEAQQPLEGWFACHWSKLHQRGLLNRSPDGCNPESGRVPGLASAGSNRTGQVRTKQIASHMGAHPTLVSWSG